MKSNSVATLHPLRRESARFNWRTWCAGLAALVLLSLSATAQTITSAVPGFFNFQGKVVTAAGSPLGASPNPVNRLVIFRIWNSNVNSAVGNLVYSEQQMATITDGEFSVLIGQGSAVLGTPLGFSEAGKGPSSLTLNHPDIFGGSTRFLGITVDDGTAAADPEISPRQQLVTSAYAFRAKYAESLGSNGASTLTVTDAGNVGIGFATPGAPLTFAPGVGEKIRFYGNFDAGIGVQAGNIQFRGSNASDDLTFGYGPSVSMTETMRIKGNGNVGIGTASPATKLDVNGVVGVFDGGVKSRNAGLQTELNGALINFGVNDSSSNRFGGTYTQADQGGQLRVDSRGAFGLFQFMGRPAGSTSISELMTITSSGNVGIGNSAPTSKLHVNGGITSTSFTTGSLSLTGAPLTLAEALGDKIRFFGSFGAGIGVQSGNIQFRGSSSGDDLTFGHGFSEAMTETMRIKGTGNVGIGTSTPAAKLDVNGNAKIAGTVDVGGNANIVGTVGVSGNANIAGLLKTASLHANSNVGTHEQGAWLEWNKAGSNGATYLLNQKGGGGGGIIFGEVTTANVITERMRIDSEGRLGIGTESPSNALVHINGGQGVNGWVGAYLAIGGPGGNQTTVHGPHSTSLRTSGTIACGNTFIAVSDARIKQILGRSEGDKDLQLLMGIEITDFRYKDTISHGSGQHKKVIAQQLEKVFPQAVTLSRDAVPDFFQSAPVAGDWVTITNNLKAGDRIRIIADKKDDLFEVLEATSGRFRVNAKFAGDKAFVWGREVSDFRSVDYEAIAMLNVSATQEIKREKDADVAALRAQNAELRDQLAAQAQRVSALEAKDQARDAKLAAIEKLLQSSQTVLARPAKLTNANGQE